MSGEEAAAALEALGVPVSARPHAFAVLLARTIHNNVPDVGTCR
jgi:hypothetical protein